jgi:KDO2-lipid IV(A) lauroyltransferase
MTPERAETFADAGFSGRDVTLIIAPMSKERIDWLDRLAYLAFRLVSTALHSLPIETNLRAARHVADFAYRVDRKHRERALANLGRAMPDLSPRQREKIARESMQELAMFFVETMFTTRKVRIDTWARHIELGGRLGETVGLLMKRNQGLIMLTAHYGNFEILGYLLATLGFPTASVARPLDNPYISEWIFGVREKMGQRIIVKKGATEEVTDELDKNGVVSFVADQNAGSKGIFVDFFGRKASTYKSIGLVAMTYNVPVVIGYAKRLSDRFQFYCGVEDIIYPDEWKDQDDPLRYITQRYTAAIESFVRKDPAQYWWVHRRWKTRPKGELPEVYD